MEEAETQRISGKKKYDYYIFCEGKKTESFYFEGFKRLIEDNPIYRDMVLIEIEPCAAETMRMIGMAERCVRKNEIGRGQSVICKEQKRPFLLKGTAVCFFIDSKTMSMVYILGYKIPAHGKSSTAAA